MTDVMAPADLGPPIDTEAPTPPAAPIGQNPSELYPPAPPSPGDLMRALGESRRKFVAELPAKVVDPTISTKDRLLTGAALYAGKRGADAEGYEAWRQQRDVGAMAGTPIRPGISERQARFIATPQDRTAQAKTLARVDDVAAARIGGWIEGYESANRPSAPVDVARFDRVVDEGLLEGRTATLYNDLLGGRIDDIDASELTSKVAEVARALDAFDDDLTVGRNGRLVGVDADTDVRLRVRYTPDDDGEPVSAPGALATLPGDWMPQSVLKGKDPTGDDIDVYVGPVDAVVIGQPNRVDAVYRRGFPAVEGPKGTPRWMSSRPVLVRDLASVRAAAQRNPTTVLDTHLSAYPGFLPYDSLVFELDKPNPRAAEIGAVRLGRGITEGPRLMSRLVKPDELVDSQSAIDALADTQWAIFPGPAKLHERYTGIDLGDGATLVFGISPAEASEVADWAFVNDGIATRHDDYEDLAYQAEAEDPMWMLRAGRDAVPITPSLEEAALVVERRTRGVDRWHLPIDERARRYVKGLADHVERLGGHNVVGYVSVPTIDGFERVREHVYGDGGSGYTVARTADPVVGDPNGLPVWVKRADELPRKWLQVAPDELDTVVEEMTAKQVNGRWQVDARGLDDVGAQVRAAHALAGKYGYDAVELRGDDGPISLARVKR
jgi:hypothetical protein